MAEKRWVWGILVGYFEVRGSQSCGNVSFIRERFREFLRETLGYNW